MIKLAIVLSIMIGSITPPEKRLQVFPAGANKICVACSIEKRAFL